MQKKIILRIVIAVWILLCLTVWFFPTFFRPKEYATLIPCVIDAHTEAPLEHAQVVVLETGKTYQTDATGHTPPIRVATSSDAHFQNILPKPWSEVSLIAYCDGYTPYAVFYLQVYPGQTRNGPNLYLFSDSGENAPPLSIIEGPDDAWVQELVRKYKP